MDYLPYFIGSGFLIVIIIVFNSRKQKSRLKEFSIEPEEAPSLLMVQSVERKLKAIYGKLFENGVKSGDNNGPAASPRKQQLIKELEQLEAAYADKKISLKDYSEKLQNLQMKVIDL
ncbi:hypothetical protein ACFQZS_05940 [Mucilaginibacter calamicampi]|uniref:Short C-terminal domain-containing protein n=1 Tax=Mucilaginibacter calamicampi TaxID=1302352 RepID=A0ABW2YWS1_9SPHI